jgi:SPP1 gp7 family putative phage head morphogenesis protein
MAFIGSLEEGSPLRKLFKSFGIEAARAVSRTLIGGLTLGWNPRKIAPLVEHALQVPRYRALVISRTEMLRSYKGAALENYKKNSDVVDKWIWHAALSNKRTCITCIAMHGTEHELSEELNGHPVCRCARIPKTKSWEDILGVKGIPDTRPKLQSGSEWFSKQDEDFQRRALGAKYNAWQEGQFELSDVVKKTHDEQWGASVQEKSLKELVK